MFFQSHLGGIWDVSFLLLIVFTRFETKKAVCQLRFLCPFGMELRHLVFISYGPQNVQVLNRCCSPKWKEYVDEQ